MYHAQNTYPYPEDQTVAEWVREEAEPNGWTKFTQELPEPEAKPVPQPQAEEKPAAPEEKPKKKISLSI